jgi:glycosyltransferase involved in cell wall biosynthesis
MRKLGSRLHLFPPSEFSANCLRQLGFEQVVVVEHGVDREFCPLTAEQLQAQMKAKSSPRDLRGEGKNLLHMAAGDLDRKSTENLIEACTRLIDRDWNLTLTMVVAGPERARLAIRTIRDPVLRERLRFLPRLNAPPSKMKWFYSAFDFIVQPSRVEGFGMCPLEALCCGVPVIVSQGTGHAQWLRHGWRGVVQVPLGPEAPMASEPNPCPTVSVEAIMDGIKLGLANSEQLLTDAVVAAPDRIKRHSWMKAISGGFRPKLQGEFAWT